MFYKQITSEKRHDNHKKILKQFYNTVWLYLLKTNLRVAIASKYFSEGFIGIYRRQFWYL